MPLSARAAAIGPQDARTPSRGRRQDRRPAALSEKDGQMAAATHNLRVVVRAEAPVSRPELPVSAGPQVVDAATLRLRYPNLETELDADAGILWGTMLHPERACFTPGLVADGRHLQGWLARSYAAAVGKAPPFRYLVWRSAARGAWSMGGDLATFTRLIRSRDEASLRAYAHAAVEILYVNYCAYELPITTVALIQGDAIGGGFETMLTNDLVIAERGSKFGLPEILFGLFPGMGAYSFLRRKVGERMARTLIEDGKSRSADEMYELGLVDIVCERGEGEATMLRYADERGSRFETSLALARMRRRSDPVTRQELADIVDLWADLALKLGEPELRRMDALARHQERMHARN
jgi:DSF synthase